MGAARRNSLPDLIERRLMRSDRTADTCLDKYLAAAYYSHAPLQLISLSMAGARGMVTSNWANPDPPVIVIGGGPAGATTSTILAQQGVRVLVFERERFPRFHIGESLIPETYWTFRRLGM